MNTPFDGRLPVGWRAEPMYGSADTYHIYDDEGVQRRLCLIDRSFDLEAQIKATWRNHIQAVTGQPFTWED